ncbi:GntR family transcriptional regulator [Candidatus Saccharibacteria bacterium]|nr:GntR family transcriptional regulator [Candidatus Saccharibacteria bacterium]
MSGTRTASRLKGRQATAGVHPGRSPRAFEHVLKHLREQLSAGYLKLGDQLPPERTLAEQLRVSRSAVREALRTLEASGVLTQQTGANGGAFLSYGRHEAVAASIRDLLDLRNVSLEQLTEARLWIEGGIVRSACRQATDDDFRLLDENVDLAERYMNAGQLAEKVATNIEFHNVLARATHNPVMALIMELLIELLRRFAQNVPPESRKLHIAWRRLFLLHLRARDEDGAVAVMEQHLARLHRRYLRHWLRRLEAMGARSGKTARARR